MRKYYSEPELEVRKYSVSASIFTESGKDPGLDDGDDYNLDSAGPAEDPFAD